MRFNKAHFALGLALLCAVALSTTAFASDWFSSDEDNVTLAEILQHPTRYSGKRVVFTVYFNEVADHYNPFYTEFHRDMYGNFAAWPIDARLYEKRDFQRCYPQFYVNRRSDVWEDVKDLKRFDAIECVGIVKQAFRGRPHIEVTEVDGVNYGMKGRQIKDAIRAHAHYLAGNYDSAEKLYARAVTAKVPATVRADLNRRLGDARYGAKHYDSAAQSYKRALRDAPGSNVLDRNMAACKQAIARANGDTQAQIEPTKRLAHHLEAVREDMTNGVDAVIAALEDPEQVETEYARQEAELAGRSVHGNNAPSVVVVSDTLPNEEAAGEPREASAEPESTEPAEEVSPEEVTTEVIEEPKAEEMPAEEAPEEVTTEVIEEPKAEEMPAEETPEEVTTEVVEEPKAEEMPAEEAPEEVTTEVVEEPKAEEMPAEEMPAEETPEEVTTEVVDEPVAEETAAEETPEVAEETPAEESPEVAGEEPVEDGTYEEPMEEEPVEPNAGPNEDNPRVMMVGNTVTMLPRLPFQGCAGVSYETFRAVVEDILDTEDPIEIEGSETEIEVSEDENAEPETKIELADESAPATEETTTEEVTEEGAEEASEKATEENQEQGEVPTEEQGEPEQSDEPVAESEQLEQPEENPGEEPAPEESAQNSAEESDDE